MNKDELTAQLNQFVNTPHAMVLEVYFVLKKDNNSFIKLADIDEDDQEALKTNFLQTLNEKIILNDEMRVVEISRIEERKNTLFYYDYNEKPEELNLITTIPTLRGVNLFTFGDDHLSEISGIVFCLSINGHNLISYKQNYPINIYKRDSKFMGLIKSNERFIQIPNDMIRIHYDFDFLFIDDKLLIKKVEVLEKHFSYNTIVTTKAQQGLELIIASDLIADTSPMQDRLTADITFARKLAQITQHSKVLDLSVNDILEFVEEERLGTRFRFNNDKSKFDLSSKKAQNEFLKLLNDDFLYSKLTKQRYESSSKDLLTVIVPT